MDWFFFFFGQLVSFLGPPMVVTMWAGRHYHPSHPDPKTFHCAPDRQPLILLVVSTSSSPLCLLTAGEHPPSVAIQAAPSQHICRQPDELEEVFSLGFCLVWVGFFSRKMVPTCFALTSVKLQCFARMLSTFIPKFAFSRVYKQCGSAEQSPALLRALQTTV